MKRSSLVLSLVLTAMTGLAGAAGADLLVSSASTDSVLRYDEGTGAFIDVFVPSGSGGLDAPTGLVFGPDGDLYAASPPPTAFSVSTARRGPSSTRSFLPAAGA